MKTVIILYLPGHAGNFVARLFSLNRESMPLLPQGMLQHHLESVTDIPEDFDRLENYRFSTVSKAFNDWQQFHRSYADHKEYSCYNLLNIYCKQKYSRVVFPLHPHEFIADFDNQSESELYYVDLDLDRWGNWVNEQQTKLNFQYRHNAPLTSRIDPGTTNIIDLYVVTLGYYTSYQNWIRDTTGTVVEPDVPTIDELSTEYQGLQDYKMLSDNIILNSVVFKPLFGQKAAQELRATIKVIRAQGSTASTSEIKSSVVASMNTYFSIDKWNFGDTFYFSELAAYLHRELGTIISSVVLVPLNSQKYFGDLYEIRSAPNEIFVNGATINNIEVIEALTSTNLRTAPGSGVI
jgi:hypothetical protein